MGVKTRGRRRIVGTFQLSGDERQTVLTISTRLDDTPFPTERGTDVQVELVEEPDEEPYLKVQPTQNGR
jgi:hypothetical protein